MSLCQSDHVEGFDIKERVRSLDFVTRPEDSGPHSFESSRAHLYSSIEIMQEILSIVQRGESLRRHQSTSPFELHASTLNAMISSTLNSNGPRLVEQDNTAAPSSFTPTWIQAIIAAQDGQLKRGEDGKYFCSVKGRLVEMSETDSQPVLQFIHETLPRDQDVQKEIETHSAILADLTQYVGGFVEALKQANFLRDKLVENQNFLQSYLHPDTELSASNQLELSDQPRQSSPANSVLEYRSGDLAHDAPDEPSSTVSESTSTQAHQISFYNLRSSTHSEIGSSSYTKTKDHTSEALGSRANQKAKVSECNNASRFRSSTGAMSDGPFNADLVHGAGQASLPRRASSFNVVESSRRNRSPTPVSTLENRIPSTDKEKLHKHPFLKTQIEKGVPWDQIRLAYKEEFGMWRSVGSLRWFFYTYKDKSKQSFSATTFSSAQSPYNDTHRRSKRTRSSTSVSRWTKSPTPDSTLSNKVRWPKQTEQEKLHRIPWLKSQLRKGVPWVQIPFAYKEEFGVWRPVTSLRAAYREEMGNCEPVSSISKVPSARRASDRGRRSKRDRSPTPVSSRGHRILATEQEKLYRLPFLESQVCKGVPWVQIPLLYKEKFGIWRSTVSLRTSYLASRRKSVLGSPVPSVSSLKRGPSPAASDAENAKSPEGPTGSKGRLGRRYRSFTG